MRVIFLKEVRGIAKKSQIKEVSDGYARNFLIPRNLAKMASESEVKIIEQKAAGEKIHRDKLAQKLTALSEEFKKNPLTFELKVGERGETFGSITAKNIEEKLEEKKIGPTRVEIEKPIKKIGLHEVEVDFGNGIKMKLSLEVVPEK